MTQTPQKTKVLRKGNFAPKKPNGSPVTMNTLGAQSKELCFIFRTFGTTCHKPAFSGWWLNQPLWKTCSSNWKTSPNRGENQKYLKPPPSCGFFWVRSFGTKPRRSRLHPKKKKKKHRRERDRVFFAQQKWYCYVFQVVGKYSSQEPHGSYGIMGYGPLMGKHQAVSPTGAEGTPCLEV